MITQKTVVHVGILGPDCTKALLNDNLLSRLREEEKDKVTAFRVCVPAAHRQQLFDPRLWSEGIIIRDWKFKAPSHGTQVSLSHLLSR